MKEPSGPLVDHLLSRGLYDLVMLSNLVWIVREHTPDVERCGIRREVVDAAEWFLRRGYIVVGECVETERGTIVSPWQCTIEQSLHKIERALVDANDKPDPGGDVWFEVTDAGLSELKRLRGER